MTSAKKFADLMLLSASTAREREIVIFGELAPDAIAKLKNVARKIESIDQYQWLLDYKAQGGIKGQLRVRRSQEHLEDDATYVLTTKAYNGPGDASESNATCDHHMFEHFKALAPEGQLKTRYSVDIPDTNLVWEIDVIYDAAGNVVPWAKIDLEVDAQSATLLEAGLPALPEGVFTRIIDRPYAERTHEENQLLDDLFKNHFYVKNPHIAPPTQPALPEGFERFVDPKVVVEMLMPYVEPLIGMIPAISYDEKYFDFDEEGQLKRDLQELKYAMLRVLKLNEKKPDCDCEDRDDE